MENILNVIMIITLIIAIIAVIYEIYSNNKNIYKNTNDFRNIDKSTDKAYKSELNKMISYYTIYMIDSKYGETFSVNKSISDDLSISDLNELKTNIVKTIMESMGSNMKLYFILTYGDKWLVDFINISVLSLLINYTKLTIESIVNLK